MKRGVGTSNGIGIGTALLIENKNIKVKVSKVLDVEKEVERFKNYKEEFIKDTEARIAELSDKLGEKTSQILKNQIYLINDSELNAGIESRITGEKLCVEAAVDEICNMYIKMFSALEDETMSQRAADIEDVKLRVLRLLMGIKEVDLSNLPENTILVAHELAPSVTAVMDTAHIVGIITEKGGTTSHASILARALEIPAVLSVKDATSIIKNKDKVIVDGEYGEIFINPIQKTIEIYERKQNEYIERVNELKCFKDKETLTSDGHKVELFANIGGPDDVARMLDFGGEGVGLFRTEFLYMNGFSMPTEDEQFESYKKAVVMAKGRPVIIRTLDIGGDKDIPYMGLAKESNPFLGYRAIRYCLDRVDIFTMQLKAILRASAFGNIWIMIPLVTSLVEVLEVKKHLANIKSEFDKNDIEYNKDVKLGVMIETPAASLIADLLAKEVDFFSIGTNDLIQYTIAVDRGNENVAYLYTPFHPSVLRSIKHVITCAKEAGIPVGMCGEAAGNANMIPLLLAFGLDEFSVTASNILETRKNISTWTIEEAKKVAKHVMTLSTDKEIINYLNDYNQRK